MMSGSRPRSVALPVWYVAPSRARAWLRTGLHAIEDVHVQPALVGDEGRQQPDRPRAGDQHGSWFPGRALADQGHLLPRFGDDRGRLEEHAENAEGAVHLQAIPARRAIART